MIESRNPQTKVELVKMKIKANGKIVYARKVTKKIKVPSRLRLKYSTRLKELGFDTSQTEISHYYYLTPNFCTFCGHEGLEVCEELDELDYYGRKCPSCGLRQNEEISTFIGRKAWEEVVDENPKKEPEVLNLSEEEET